MSMTVPPSALNRAKVSRSGAMSASVLASSYRRAVPRPMIGIRSPLDGIGLVIRAGCAPAPPTVSVAIPAAVPASRPRRVMCMTILPICEEIS